MPAPPPVTFAENAAYTLADASRILHRSPKTLRSLCRSGRLPAVRDRGGYLVSGWVIRAYLENRLSVARE